MKLNKKNLLAFLKDVKPTPCNEGMRALRKLFRQKKGMEYIFVRMSKMRRAPHEDTFAVWAHDRLLMATHWNYPDLYSYSFQNFKLLFEKLPEG